MQASVVKEYMNILQSNYTPIYDGHQETIPLKYEIKIDDVLDQFVLRLKW